MAGFCVQGFIGFSTGGKLIRVYGREQHLHPSDGGVATVENIRHAEGTGHKIIDNKQDFWGELGGGVSGQRGGV